MSRQRRTLGFTLVEVLIAMVITTAAVALAAYAYANFIDKWKSEFGEFDRLSATSRAVWQTQTAIGAAVPFIVWSERQKEYVFYFLGREEGATFVTRGAIFNPDGSSVVRIFSEQQANGSFRLVYEEAPLSDELLYRLNQELDFAFRLILLKDQPKISFEYFGYETRAVADAETTAGGKPQWFKQYDSADTKLQPERVKILLGDDYLVQELPSVHPNLMDLFIDE